MVILAEGTDKKVKAKSPDAFVVIAEQDLQNAPFEWSFTLPLDSRISDKNGALYLLYGHGQNIEKLGQLRLNILPHSHLKDLIDLLCSHFRFALKTISASKKGMIEIKLDPPSSKEWSMLEQLVIQGKITESELECKFQFHRNEVDATKGGLASKSVKREIDREWKIKMIIHDFNQRLNKEVMTSEMDQVIAEYRDAGWLSS
jgi:hypothetical protein